MNTIAYLNNHVKSREIARLKRYFRRARVMTPSVQRIAIIALSMNSAEVTERQLRALTGYATSTIRLACHRLVGLKVLTPVPKPLGRGYLKAYRIVWGAERSFSRLDHSNLKKSPNKTIKSLKAYKTHTKDTPIVSRVRQSERGSEGAWDHTPRPSRPQRRSTRDYQSPEDMKVTLILGARFYRDIMRIIRLSLEEWALSEHLRDAIEGFYGHRIDGTSLRYARALKEQIWAMRSEVERLAAAGATARRIICFIAGRITGVLERRARREVARRTATLSKTKRRIAGLTAWLAARIREYREGRACTRCGYRHTERDYYLGRYQDGRLNCFGFGRIKREELYEQMKLIARRERCRQCGGPLLGGHVEGLCWDCYENGDKCPHLPPLTT